MNRIALAKRLEGLSKVFASETPYHRDLKAMSEVLSKVEDEKFNTILSSDYTPEACDEVDAAGQVLPYQSTFSKHPGNDTSFPSTSKVTSDPKVIAQALDKLVQEQPKSVLDSILSMFQKKVQEKSVMAPEVPKIEHQPQFNPAMGQGVPATPGLTREASVGMFWSKEASDAVLNNLIRDVVGMDKSICCDTKRHLDKDQTPDGTHKGEKAPTLKTEQTPDISKSLKSDIVEKSHGKVNKEASECAKEEDGTKEEDKDASLETIKKDKEEKKQQDIEKTLEDLKETKADKDAGIDESFELGSSMDEITLDAAEQDKLNNLFVY